LKHLLEITLFNKYNIIGQEVGMAKRGGPCGSARGPQVKNAGRVDLFNPLTRISPPRISRQPARASSGAGRADPQTRKKKIGT